MSFFSILETLLLGPLKLIFEVIYVFAYNLSSNPGLSIIFLSLAMNILVLPLYRRADAMQEAARDTEARLHRGVSHIKKTFSGDEKMMILQTYYRQNGYKPTSSLNGSVSLLLEIPFFMAAYQFLSNLKALEGISFGPISDLGSPDGLIAIGDVSINLLPILMTLINVISSYLFLKGHPLKTKIQLYAMAAFFLVFLYNSPSCLVFYWTLNNVFSLVKTILYKLPNPTKILSVALFIIGAPATVLSTLYYRGGTVFKTAFVIALSVSLMLPLIWRLLKKKLPPITFGKGVESTPHRKTFLLGAVFLSVLIGAMIPSTYISSSPMEFVVSGILDNPLWYVVHSLAISAGFFLVWMGVFYWLASPLWKVIFERVVWILCGVGLMNYMFFGLNLGVISPYLVYDNTPRYGVLQTVVNCVCVAILACFFWYLCKRWRKLPVAVLSVAILAVCCVSLLNVFRVQSALSDVQYDGDKNASIPLSKTGKNVVVLMLDRAMGQYVPFIMNEKPELKEKFSGFTYYSNTISFGGFTNIASPALMGGYEYTPVEMNRRDQETLVSKHNESHKVMPYLFDSEGYEVTICDPLYMNYNWKPDVTAFPERDVNVYSMKEKYLSQEQRQFNVESNFRNFFCFSLMKVAPVPLQSFIYNGGNYYQAASEYSAQWIFSPYTAYGTNSLFMDAYNILDSLPDITKVQETGDHFLFMTNDITHEPALLQLPEYKPQNKVDNTAYETANADRYTLNGVTLKMGEVRHQTHYQSNMAAFLLLADWFDHLRQVGVYDNTRIILVADHGQDLSQIQSMIHDPLDYMKNTEMYFPLLMVKDFDAEGFTVSNEFMTNADVPTLATSGIINNPKNPFTGKLITSQEKFNHKQFVSLSTAFEVSVNNGNTFLPSKWASVEGNIWERENWTYYDEETVLKEHAAP